jgi:hypothetical protein
MHSAPFWWPAGAKKRKAAAAGLQEPAGQTPKSKPLPSSKPDKEQQQQQQLQHEKQQLQHKKQRNNRGVGHSKGEARNKQAKEVTARHPVAAPVLEGKGRL